MLAAFKSYGIISATKRPYLLNSGSIDLHARISKNQGSEGASDLITFSSRNERHCSQSIVNSKGFPKSGIPWSNGPNRCIICSTFIVIGTFWILLCNYTMIQLWSVYSWKMVFVKVADSIFRIVEWYTQFEFFWSVNTWCEAPRVLLSFRIGSIVLWTSETPKLKNLIFSFHNNYPIIVAYGPSSIFLWKALERFLQEAGWAFSEWMQSRGFR